MRQRIVINVDAPSGSAPQPRAVAGVRRRRWPRFLAIFIGLVLVMVVAAAAGGFFWWRQYQSTPSYTLALMIDAVQRNDAAEFEKRIDSEEIAKNMVGSISEKAASRYGMALSSSMRQQIDNRMPALLPAMKQKIHDEVVKEIKAFAATSDPPPFIVLLVTVSSLLNVTTEGDVAKATASVSNRTIELTMKRDGDRWKVTEFKDDVVVQRIVDSIMSELPAIGTIDANSPLFKRLARGKRARRR